MSFYFHQNVPKSSSIGGSKQKLKPKKKIKNKSLYRTLYNDPRVKKSAYRNTYKNTRSSIEVQTDSYLELLPEPNNLKNVMIQTTKELLPKKQIPKFIKKEVGKSVATWIDDGDLFNFDREVEPILEVLIGKCIDQSLLEVQEEEEIKYLKRRRIDFIKERDIAQAEADALEEETRIRVEERKARILQEKIRLQAENDIKNKLKAQQASERYLAQLDISIMNALQASGHFNDPIDQQVTNTFIPWLMNHVKDELQQTNTSRNTLDYILNHINQT